MSEPFATQRPTVIVGLESRGMLLGALVAQRLGVAFVEIRKDHGRAADSDEWLTVTTPPDYRDRRLKLGFRRSLVTAADRVVLVDDSVATGGQALGARRLIRLAGAHWLGMSAIVDGLDDHQTRRELAVTALLHVRHL